MQPTHIEFPVARWDKIIDWLEQQKDYDATRIAESLIRRINEDRIPTPGQDPELMVLYTFMGHPVEKLVSAAIKATE